MKTELEIIKEENQSYRNNLPKFQVMAENMNEEIVRANAEAIKWKSMYEQSQRENQMLNKFNMAFIGMSLGVIGATIIFIATHFR